MKLSTRSRYGTRMMLDLAEHYGKGAVHLADIARRQDLSVKYLEQIIRILKKARYVDSFRGPKGGHKLARPPEAITVGEVVALLEKSKSLVHCGQRPKSCRRSGSCRLAQVWAEAAEAMFDRLYRVTLADLIDD